MTVMSFNIFCCGVGKYSWKKRREAVLETIKRYLPDTIGVQEAHTEWMRFLTENLPVYDYEGMGRDDGKDEGEFSSVFYRKDKFERLDGASFWLSENPSKPGKGWDGFCPRTCSYVKLKDRETGKVLFHFNTHLDHKGSTARREGARLIVDRINKLCLDTDRIIITGDFNSHPAYFTPLDKRSSDETNESNMAYSVITENGYDDARRTAKISDTTHTFHDYSDVTEIIDYIFTKNITVNEFKVVTDKSGDMYPSDHFPIKAEYSL